MSTVYGYKTLEEAIRLLRLIRDVGIAHSVPTDFLDPHGAPYAHAEVFTLPKQTADQVYAFLKAIDA